MDETLRTRWRKLERNPTVRSALVVIGAILIVLSPIIGVLPGPGFIILFPLGLGLMLKYSRWAKRRYVGFKRRWPQHGGRVDLLMRRASARRRAELTQREGN